ncbi:MAG TPA: NAD-dependent epimerase/dehydratase family protein, partial [Polyangiaceae bacterium]
MSSVSSVVVLGCGFTGIEVARRTREAGARVLATTRARERVALLEGMGLEAVVAPELSPSVLREKVEGAHVLVSYPPDGQTDSRVAPALGSAARVVYISSTGVYGAARGRVDERTPVDPATPTARARLDAEHAYLEHGAAVLRAAGIYGPFRGLHRRLLSGDYRVVEGGANVVSRVHVADLASMVIGLFHADDGAARGSIYVAADDMPVP